MAGDVLVPACKEWAVVVDALLRGEQILDLRKGGVHEEGRRFELQADRFWLFPTYEHQDADLLKPAHQAALERARADHEGAGADRVRIEGWADVAGTALLTDPEIILSHESQRARRIWLTAPASRKRFCTLCGSASRRRSSAASSRPSSSRTS